MLDVDSMYWSHHQAKNYQNTWVKNRKKINHKEIAKVNKTKTIEIYLNIINKRKTLTNSNNSFIKERKEFRRLNRTYLRVLNNKRELHYK